jgi:hypothetical protein
MGTPYAGLDAWGRPVAPAASSPAAAPAPRPDVTLPGDSMSGLRGMPGSQVPASQVGGAFGGMHIPAMQAVTPRSSGWSGTINVGDVTSMGGGGHPPPTYAGAGGFAAAPSAFGSRTSAVFQPNGYGGGYAPGGSSAYAPIDPAAPWTAGPETWNGAQAPDPYSSPYASTDVSYGAGDFGTGRGPYGSPGAGQPWYDAAANGKPTQMMMAANPDAAGFGDKLWGGVKGLVGGGFKGGRAMAYEALMDRPMTGYEKVGDFALGAGLGAIPIVGQGLGVLNAASGAGVGAYRGWNKAADERPEYTMQSQPNPNYSPAGYANIGAYGDTSAVGGYPDSGAMYAADPAFYDPSGY